MEPRRLYLFGRVVSMYWLLAGNIYNLLKVLLKNEVRPLIAVSIRGFYSQSLVSYFGI